MDMIENNIIKNLYMEFFKKKISNDSSWNDCKKLMF